MYKLKDVLKQFFREELRNREETMDFWFGMGLDINAIEEVNKHDVYLCNNSCGGVYPFYDNINKISSFEFRLDFTDVYQELHEQMFLENHISHLKEAIIFDAKKYIEATETNFIRKKKWESEKIKK